MFNIIYSRIEFVSGRLTNRTYTYKAKNQFKPSLLNFAKEPLYLSDFKELEIIYQPTIGRKLVKCTFINGEESLALIDSALLKTLYIYLYNKANAKDNEEIIIPDLYSDFPRVYLFVIIVLALYLCLLYALASLYCQSL
mgnify:CR=1 FL=1